MSKRVNKANEPHESKGAGRGVLRTIREIKQGSLDPKLLSPEDRKACVGHVIAEGLTVVETAQLFKVADPETGSSHDDKTFSYSATMFSCDPDKAFALGETLLALLEGRVERGDGLLALLERRLALLEGSLARGETLLALFERSLALLEKAFERGDKAFALLETPFERPDKPPRHPQSTF